MRRLALLLLVLLALAGRLNAADLVSVADGNLTTAATWNISDHSLISTSTSTTTLTTGNLDSATFVPTNTAIQCWALRLASRATGSPTNTLTTILRNSTTSTNVLTVTLNVSDLPVADTTADQGGWFKVCASASTTPNGTDSYVIRNTLSATSTAVALSTNGTANNWQRMVLRTATQAPVAGDDLHCTGTLDGSTNPATVGTRAVTMDETATTDYGSAQTNYRVAALNISKGCTFAYGVTASTNYILRLSGHLIVYSGGVFNQGKSGTPVPRSSTAELQFDCPSDSAFGLIVRSLGTRTAEGESRLSGVNNTYVLLNADAAAAATSVTTDTQLSAKNGDDIAFASTSTTRAQHELRVMNGDAGATSLSITAGLTNAHNGDNNSQGEIAVLTRNVRTVGVTSTFMTFEDWLAGSLTTVRWAEWRYIGTSAVNGLRINNTGAVLDSCVLRDGEGYPLYIGPTAVTTDIDDMVTYNFPGPVNDGTVNIDVTASQIAIDGLVMIATGTGSNAYGIRAQNAGVLTQFDNIRVSGSIVGIIMGIGGQTMYTANGLVANTWVTHSTASGTGVSFTGNLNDITVVGINSWSNGQGLETTGGHNVTLRDFALHDNGTGFYLNGAMANLTVVGGSICSNSSSGVNILGGVAVSNATFQNVAFGTTAGGSCGVNHASNLDFEIGNAVSRQNFYEVTFIDCTFNKSTASTWHQTTFSVNGSMFAWQRRNGTDGQNVIDRLGYGVLARETTTVDASPGLKLTPASARLKFTSAANLPGRGFFVPVTSGQTPTVSIKVQKDGSYNGNAPRFILKANAALGIDADVVLDTLSVGASTWETLTGTTAAVSADGVLEFVVDCDGTAGNIYVDTFAVTGAGATDPSTLTYFFNGLPAVFLDSVVGAGSSEHSYTFTK